MTHIW